MHATIPVEHRATAVAPFHRHRQLDHLDPIDLSLPRHPPRHHTPLKPTWISNGDHLLAISQAVRLCQLQRVKPCGTNPDDCQVARPVRGMHCCHVVLRTVSKLHTNRAGFTNHMQVGGNQAVRIDHKAGPQTLLITVAACVPDGHNRVANNRHEFFHTRRLE